MNPLDLILTIAGIATWSWLMLGYGELIDRWKRVDDAHQEKLSKPVYSLMRFMVWFGKVVKPIPLWATGTAAIAIIGWTHPDAFNIAGLVGGGVMWARSLGDEQEELPEVQQMRAALGDLVKDPDNPPTVMLDGEHLDGGPLRVHIGGHPNFKEYTKAHRDALENIIEYRLPGDYEIIDWFGNGSSDWERVIHPPTRVDYTRHFKTLPNGEPWPWHQIPVGVDDAGEVRVMDLRRTPHWIIAGNTTSGKTSAIRPGTGHVLDKGVKVAAIDVKGGLAYLRGRRGVWLCATRRIDQLTEGMKRIYDEIAERCDLFDRDGTYREPLVVFCDEVATACEWAGGKKSEFASYLLRCIRLGAQVRVHFILSTQRPSADALPIEIRGQAEGRVAVGPMEPEVAQMMFEREWVRAVNLRKVKGTAILGDSSGQDNIEVQAFWLADPHDTDHDTDERDRADNLLPPVTTRGTTMPDSGDTATVEDLDKSRIDGGITGVSTRDGRSTDVPTGETPWERRKRLNREGMQRSRAEYRMEIRNPHHPDHGTRKAYEVGQCRCPSCVAWKTQSTQKVSA